MPSIIYGDDDIKVSAEIENCELSYANECDSFIYAANFEKISFKDTDFNGKCTDSVVKVWGEEGRINDSGLKTNASSLVAKATGVFTCSPI